MDTALSQRSVERVVDALIVARLVDPSAREQSMAVVADVLATSLPVAEGDRRRNLPQLVEVVAYLGGALVLSAGALFVFQEWGELGFVPQVVLLVVVTAVLLVAGGMAAGVPDDGPGLRDRAHDARRRLAGALFTFAGVGAGLLVGLLVDRWTTTEFPEVYWPAVLGAVAGVVVGAIGYRVAPTAIGLMGTIVGAVTATMNLIDGLDSYAGDALGVALFLLGVVWLGLAELGVFHDSTVARSLGVAVALVGAQVPVIDGTHSGLGYALTVLVAIAGVWLYLTRLAWPYLAAAVVAVTLVVPETVTDWSDGSIGAVGGVLVAGVTLLLASYAGYRIRAGAID